MKSLYVLLFLALSIGLCFAGQISGTITNATSVEGMVLVIAMLHAGITDLTSAPNEMAFFPDFPYDYTITNDAIVSMNFYFPVAYMPRGIMPASGDPFGARLFPPVIPIGGVATGVDLTLFSSGNIGGNITYSGSPDKLCINVYDYYSYPTPRLESTHFVGRRNYLLEVIPSGPKQVQAFDDINGNRRFDEGEPNAFYEMPLVGIDIVLVTGNVSGSGINITIPLSDIDEEEFSKPSDFSMAAYPNPFNSAVRIEVGNGDLSVESVEIFDLSGRLVDIVEKTKAVGIPSDKGEGLSRDGIGSEFIWTPTSQINSGVYLVRASTKGDDGMRPFVQTKRVVYLK